LVRTLRFDKPHNVRCRTPQAPRRGEECSDESIPTARCQHAPPSLADAGYDENHGFKSNLEF